MKHLRRKDRSKSDSILFHPAILGGANLQMEVHPNAPGMLGLPPTATPSSQMKPALLPTSTSMENQLWQNRCANLRVINDNVENVGLIPCDVAWLAFRDKPACKPARNIQLPEMSTCSYPPISHLTNPPALQTKVPTPLKATNGKLPNQGDLSGFGSGSAQSLPVATCGTEPASAKY